MLEATGEKGNIIDRDNSKSCLCAFKLMHDGTYVGGSFSVSTFVWAVVKIIKEKNLRVNLSTEEVGRLNSENK